MSQPQTAPNTQATNADAAEAAKEREVVDKTNAYIAQRKEEAAAELKRQQDMDAFRAQNAADEKAAAEKAAADKVAAEKAAAEKAAADKVAAEKAAAGL